MSKNKRIHLEISERKILLRIMDALFVLGILYVIGASFHFDYFTVTVEQWLWSLVLALYITFFGTVFELYDLKASSKLDTSFRNIVLTASLTVLVYLLHLLSLHFYLKSVFRWCIFIFPLLVLFFYGVFFMSRLLRRLDFIKK